MERSRLPLPSLLGLFGALLMLSPELLLGMSEDLSDVPLSDPGMQKALAFVVEQYNQDRGDNTNYFKMLRVEEAQTREIGRKEYHLTVDFVEAACTKTPGRRRKYQWIQKCKQLSGKPEERNCYFIAVPSSPPTELKLVMTNCIGTERPKKLFCSG